MVIIWSFSFVLVDIAVVYTSPLSLALYRFVIASIAFIIMDLYFFFKKNKNQPISKEETNKFSKNEWLLIILASFSGCSFFFFAQYTAIELIGPTLPALFVCLLCPIIITILALIFFEEKLDKFKILGFSIATIGGFLLVTGGDIRNLTPQSPYFIGYILALLTPFLWAFYSTITKKIVKSKSNIKMLEYISYFGMIELMLFVIVSGDFLDFAWNLLNIYVFLSAVFLGVGCYIFGYYIWNSTQKKMKSSKVSSFLYIEPFLTLLFSIMLQREEVLNLWNLLGGSIVLAGVLIINYK
ncbi:MAG: DMT family transporter [Promethearchaeota archaeon]